MGPLIRQSCECSARLVIAEAQKKGGMSVSKTFMRRLVWRDLAYWQLHHWPDMPLRPIRSHYTNQVCLLTIVLGLYYVQLYDYF